MNKLTNFDQTSHIVKNADANQVEKKSVSLLLLKVKEMINDKISRVINN